MPNKSSLIPSREQLCAMFAYDASTGILTRRVAIDAPAHHKARWNGRHAGSARSCGYREIGIGRLNFYEHHIIFKMAHGYVADVIDHIDGDRANNRIENLRECSTEQNACNARHPHGILPRGVKRKKARYGAQISIKGKMYYLGSFATVEEAAAAYVSAAQRMRHPDFVGLHAASATAPAGR